MSQLPIGWEEVQIGEVTQIVGGGTPSTNDQTNFSDDGGIPWITPSDLSGYEEIYISRGARNLSKKGFDSCSAFLLPKNSVLFSSRAPIGYVVIASNELATNQGFKSFILPKELDSKYIYYYLRHITPIAESVSTGTTFKELSATKAKLLPLLVPPHNGQKRIADKLDTLLARIDACQERLDRVQLILNRFRQSVLAEATSGALTQDWRRENNEDYFGFNSFNFEDATCFGDFTFPSSWNICRLKDIAEITSGITKSSKLQDPSFEEIPYLRVANVQRGYFDLTDVKTIRAPQKQIEDRLLESGDILFNEGGDIDKLGRGWVWSGEIDRCIFQNHVFRARLNDASFNPEFFSYYSNSRGADYFLEFGKQTTNLASINKTILSALPVVVPPAEEQHEIVRRIETLFAFADRIEARNQKAQMQVAHLIPTLLDKAFKGELVPQNPNDEPASVLLERIKEARANAPVKQKKPRRRPEMADKKTNRRKKTEPISIVQALSDAGQELSASDLFIEAGYPSDADSEQIEAFFVAVRDALVNKDISKARRHDIDWFTLESEIVTNEN